MEDEIPTVIRRGRILIVDDEDLIASALARALRADHDVEIASRAHDALLRLRRGNRFDAIVCDLAMPDMTGMQLYATLQDEIPEQAAAMIFMTAGACTREARVFLQSIANARLEKPFPMPALTKLIGVRLTR